MSGKPSITGDDVPPVVMVDPGDGKTADKDIRGSSHDLGGHRSQPTREHQGKDLSPAHPSDDDAEVSEEAVYRNSPPDSSGGIGLHNIPGISPEKKKKKRIPPPKIPGEFAPPDVEACVQIGEQNLS